MKPDLKGKRAIVTGGTRGIGYAIAEALASCGASVAICATRNVKDAVAKLSAGGAHIVGKAVDVTDSEQVKDFFLFVDQELSGLDILVNNAGIGVFRPTAELTKDDWRKTLSVNLDGVFYCCNEAIPRMRRNGGGFIVNISSLAGKNPFAGGAAYNASKFALNGFSEAMMLDHRQDDIRVSYIMPGSVDTDFSPRTGRAAWKIAPEDVAEVVLNVLGMPTRTLVSRVEIRPSKPPK